MTLSWSVKIVHVTVAAANRTNHPASAPRNRSGGDHR